MNTQARMNLSDFIVAKDSEEERRTQYENLVKFAKQFDIDYDQSGLPNEIHKHRLKTNGKAIVGDFTPEEQSQILDLLESVFAGRGNNAYASMMEIANMFKNKIDANSRIKYIEARQTVVQDDLRAYIRHVYALSSAEITPPQLADEAPEFSSTNNNLLYTEIEAKRRPELGGVVWHIDDYANAERTKFKNETQGGHFVSVFSAADNATGSFFLPGKHIPVHSNLSRALQNKFLRYGEAKQQYVEKLDEDMRRHNPQQARIGQILCTSNTLHRAPYSTNLRPGNTRYMVRVTLENTDKVTMYDIDADELVFNLKLRLRV